VAVAVAAFEFPQVVLDGVPDGGAVGQPDRQAGSDERVGVEVVEFAAEPPMVDHDGFPSAWGEPRDPAG
jgi:hypothetical protein